MVYNPPFQPSVSHPSSINDILNGVQSNAAKLDPPPSPPDVSSRATLALLGGILVHAELGLEKFFWRQELTPKVKKKSKTSVLDFNIPRTSK
jgi:hypothetical protein